MISIDWKCDYEQLLYQIRERMKQDAYSHLCDESIPFDLKVRYAEQIIESHFMRSVQAFIDNCGTRKKHPKFDDYAAMMLNQDSYLKGTISEDVRNELISIYGKQKGIKKGSYYCPEGI